MRKYSVVAHPDKKAICKDKAIIWRSPNNYGYLIGPDETQVGFGYVERTGIAMASYEQPAHFWDTQAKKIVDRLNHIEELNNEVD